MVLYCIFYFQLIILFLCQSTISSSNRISPVGAAMVNFHEDNDGKSNKEENPFDSKQSFESIGDGDAFSTRPRMVAPKSGNSVSSSAGIQYMITNKMRAILEDELGYLSSEVDRMEPQIAAVVIEKMLPRPPRGMPINWAAPTPLPTESRRWLWSPIRHFTAKTRKIGSQLMLMTSQTTKFMSTRIIGPSYRFIRSWVPIAVPLLSAAYISPYLVRYIFDSDDDYNYMHGGTHLHSEQNDKPKRWLPSIRLWPFSTSSTIENCKGQNEHRKPGIGSRRIDIRELNRASTLSWKDRVSRIFSNS